MDGYNEKIPTLAQRKQNLRMTVFEELTIESTLPNQIQLSWYHSFEKKTF